MAEKNKMLKVVSIIMLVCAVLCIIGGVLIFAMGDMLADIMIENGSDVSPDMVKIVLAVLAIPAIVDGLLYLLAGIAGIKQKNPKGCKTWGIVLVVLCAIAAASSLFSGQFYSLASLVLPILYLVGAVKYKKACDEAAKETLEGETL